MDTGSILHYTALISMVIGALSVAVAFFIYRETVKTQIFLDLSSRYDELLHSSSSALWLGSQPEALLPERSCQLTVSALRFCTLVSLAYYLFRERRISKAMWELMLRSAERRMRSNVFLREWEYLRPEFDSFPEFVAIVDSVRDGR